MQVAAPMQGTVVSIDVGEGDPVKVSQQLVVLVSLEMEHVVAAVSAGVVTRIPIAVVDTVMPGDALLLVELREGVVAAAEVATEADAPVYVRADLAEVLARYDARLY